MNKVNRDAIKQLIEGEDNATISLYMPTHRFPTSEHIVEDKIRFKNLIREAKEMLVSWGAEEDIASKMLADLEAEYYNDDTFWQKTTEGLAVFCSPASTKYFNLPIECDEHVNVGDKFDITPLLAIASGDQPYYLLALATHNPVLYKGDMYGIERVDIELAESPEVALNIDESHANSQTDRASSGAGSKAHGQGDSRQAGQEERLKYFRIIDEEIRASKLVKSDLPFLLVGTDDEVSGYRESTKLSHVLESSLGGNYTDMVAHEIHSKSWPLIQEELCSKARADEIDKMNSLVGTGKASAGAEDIVSAAKDGRVDALLVGMLVETMDTVSDSDEPVIKLVLPDSYIDEGVDVSGRATFDQGGRVVAVSKDSLPDGASEAAIYRY